MREVQDLPTSVKSWITFIFFKELMKLSVYLNIRKIFPMEDEFVKFLIAICSWKFSSFSKHSGSPTIWVSGWNGNCAILMRSAYTISTRNNWHKILFSCRNLYTITDNGKRSNFYNFSFVCNDHKIYERLALH